MPNSCRSGDIGTVAALGVYLGNIRGGGYGLTRATLMIAANGSTYGGLLPRLQHGHIWEWIGKLPGVIWPTFLFCEALKDSGINRGQFWPSMQSTRSVE